MTDVELFALWYISMLLLWFVSFLVMNRRRR